MTYRNQDFIHPEAFIKYKKRIISLANSETTEVEKIETEPDKEGALLSDIKDFEYF